MNERRRVSRPAAKPLAAPEAARAPPLFICFVVMVKFTLEDFSEYKENCGNCTYRGVGCVRKTAKYKDGVRNSCTGNIDGFVYKCVWYQGQKKKKVKKELDLFRQ